MLVAPTMHRNDLLESPTKGGMLVGHTSEDIQDTMPAPKSVMTTSEVCVAIVGVGFVGESLLHEFSRVFPTIGFDISPKRIVMLQQLIQPTHQPIELTTDEAALDRATHFLISVPTLLRNDRSINLDYVVSAVTIVLSHARPGSTIVLESSVSIGTTRKMLGPHSTKHHIGMSPERVDPGRSLPAAHNIPKIISGLDSLALKSIHTLYSKVFTHIVPVSSTECAEMTKLFENSFRMVNIAYVNEMSDLACRSGVDPAEMIEAADTKPYGFMRFSPGLGVGGHCIPVNPYYLFETAGKDALPVLERATKGMWARPRKMARSFHHSVNRCSEYSIGRKAVEDCAPAVKQPKLLVVGVGFKPGQKVVDFSPGLNFAEKLRKLGCARLAFYDPLVDAKVIPWMEKLESHLWCCEYIDCEFDGVAVCSAQEGVDLGVVQGLSRAFVRSYIWAR